MLQLESYLTQQIENSLKILDFPFVAYQYGRPKSEAHGDISINLAMLLAKRLKKNPRQIAAQIVESLNLDTLQIENIEIAGPGFINFFIANHKLQHKVTEILQAGPEYGRSFCDTPLRALVEFVSANPTGPLSIGHGRQAVLGDTIANLLEWSGYEITREYYFNNAGRQMQILGDSVKIRYLQLLGDSIEFPEDYYQGEYITDIAKQIFRQDGDSHKDDEENIFKETAEKEIFKDIQKTLANLNIHFDTFFNESDLYKEGDIEAIIQTLKQQQLAYQKDNALWFKSTELGLEQDRVIVKSSGEPTYRLPDIAYHCRKYKRGYDLIVDIFGADHIATYPDVLAGLKALGYDPEKIKVLIHQFVTLFEGNQKVKMSTRKANFVTLDELMLEVGADVTRWFFLMRNMQSHLNFDLKLAKTHSDENPVYYNQYAYARICSILRNVAEKNIPFQNTGDFSLLTEAREMALIKKLIEFPKTIHKCAREYEPHLLTQYLSDVSTCFHKFYTECRVVDEENLPLTEARLGACLAAKTVLENGLKILGINAPERM